MDTDKIEQLVEYELKRVTSITRLGVTQFIWNSEQYGDRAELEAAIRKFVVAGQPEKASADMSPSMTSTDLKGPATT